MLNLLVLTNPTCLGEQQNKLNQTQTLVCSQLLFTLGNKLVYHRFDHSRAPLVRRDSRLLVRSLRLVCICADWTRLYSFQLWGLWGESSSFNTWPYSYYSFNGNHCARVAVIVCNTCPCFQRAVSLIFHPDLLLWGQYHFGEHGITWELGHPTSSFGQLALVVKCTEGVKLFKGHDQWVVWWWIHIVKVQEVIDAQRLQ